MPPASALPEQPPEGKAKSAFVDGAPSSSQPKSLTSLPSLTML